MNKTVLIHIGPPKTGTSAIQYALQKHNALLRSNGVYYPDHELGPNDISSGNMQTILSLNDEGKWSLCLSKVKKIMAEFESSHYECLLLSSEYFFYLAKDIANSIPQATFIAYIRCPLETFESSYNQAVKRHMRTTPIEFGKNLHVTTLNILRSTISEIGNKRFILSAYLPKSLTEFSLIHDFCTAGKLPLLPEAQTLKNKSYTYEALECKRWLNKFDMHDLNAEIDKILQAYEEGERHFSFLPESLFNRYKKQAFQEVNAFIKDHKVLNGRTLALQLKDRPLIPYYEQSLSNKALAQVCAYMSKQNPDLYKRMCKILVLSKHSHPENSERIQLFLKPLSLSHRLRLKLIQLKVKIS